MKKAVLLKYGSASTQIDNSEYGTTEYQNQDMKHTSECCATQDPKLCNKVNVNR